ncbi:alpha-ketoglutarate-dependent sulfonate dioxygenase [Ophiostoma piceae UAMH 11346]|uniref:Alpha-ketoglutarate-dependent sulfonate dioxygenase n=1 Tax=Ophiostoma piceae (strain UAMH 11346) TaxID=1262450 RepID=S3D6R2_OPHP1|nr:alpha-ketoglutarate-dependent sulfonate dioxygenase [Ophiostoma piceae UAMH 11346]
MSMFRGSITFLLQSVEMPLFKSKSTEKRPPDEKAPPNTTAAAASPANGNTNGAANGAANGAPEPLPVYSVQGQTVTDEEVSAAAAAAAASVDIGPLSLPASPVELSSSACLAHLRLLYALQALKEDVGYNDGLFGLPDSLASNASLRPLVPKGQRPPDEEQDRIKARLALVREKRWGLYVARAVDRYAAWWDALPLVRDPITEHDMNCPSKPKYTEYATQSAPMEWTRDTLPPLDVLMVLHAHMLNPRDFLEDCMRHGVPGLWAAGFPWALVNECISSGDFAYSVPDATKAQWTAQHSLAWDNIDDSPTKTLACPACQAAVFVPWTTVGADADIRRGYPVYEMAEQLNGTGYGDAGFSLSCPTCTVAITPQVLSVAKFKKDAWDLLQKNIPLPGTVLELATGTPSAYKSGPLREPRSMPNSIIKYELASWSCDLLGRDAGSKPETAPTMELLRVEIEKIFADRSRMGRLVYVGPGHRISSYRAPREARMSVRKMMSRYWTNYSPFALDLVGAVLRQGVFSQKMHGIDWLHSPTAKATMDRLITKYKRFVGLMAEYPTMTCVPTLDVDLAWHTHQLSPSRYYAYTVSTTEKKVAFGQTVAGKFIDHDDKIDEDRLDIYYEFTSKVYQQKYNEVYSECTCWYCESIRAAHVSSVGRLLGVSNNERINDDFHQDCRANAAHISAHNAVAVTSTNAADGLVRERVRARQLQRLETNYQKAAKRAEKKGRKLPPRSEYYDHWGYSYYMYSPYMYPYYYTYGVGPYYGGDPGSMPVGSGATGGCANGTCGNGVGAGACGGPGGCGGCSSGGCGGGTAGGCGGGGGGCGGGGGGCGGGGGGGGCGGGGGGGCGGGGS